MDDYTDEQMIRMLTNECPKAFLNVVDYIMRKLSAQMYRFVMRHGGQEIHVDEILNYAIMEAYLRAIKGTFADNTNVLGFVVRVAEFKFFEIIKGDKKFPTTSIDDLTVDLKDSSNDEVFNEIADVRTKAILGVLEELKPRDKAFFLDAILSGMKMEELAKEYSLKNAQNARNKKRKILKKIRDILNNNNNEDE